MQRKWGRVINSSDEVGKMYIDARVLDHLAAIGAIAHAARIDDIDGIAFRSGDLIGFVVRRSRP